MTQPDADGQRLWLASRKRDIRAVRRRFEVLSGGWGREARAAAHRDLLKPLDEPSAVHSQHRTTPCP